MLVDRASGTIRDLRRELRDLDADARKAGRSMDDLSGPKAAQSMQRFAGEQRAARQETRALGQEFRTAEQNAQRLETQSRRTRQAFDSLGSTRGLERVNTQLAEMEARLERVVRRAASMGGSGGGGGGIPAIGAGGAGGPGGLLGSAGGRAGLLPWWAALAPVVPQLLGGAGALVGSAGSAALGAGAVGLGGLSSFAAGAALTAVVAKPAISALTEVTKAQDAYNKSVQEFGAQSRQATTAQRNLNQAIVANPAAVGAARQLTQTRTALRTAFAPAQAAVYGGISNVLYNAAYAAPTLGTAAIGATGASAGAASAFSQFLAQPQQQATLLQLTGAFAQNLPIAERSLENIATVFGHLAVDAQPFFHEANAWVERWTGGLAQSSANQARVQGGMQKMVDSAKDWARLLGEGGRVLRDIFSPAAQPGDSMVVQFTHTLDRWDTWLRDNPDKVRKFFSDGATAVERIATVIGNLTRDVAQLFGYLDPILSRAEQFLSFTSGLGGGNLLTGAGLLYGGYQGARGALGGRGPGAGGLLSSFIFGSPRGLTSGGGGAAGTAAVTPMEAAAVGRASNLDVARGSTAAGAILLGGATVGPDAVLARRAAATAAADTRAFSGLRGQVATMIENSPIAARVADAAGTARDLALGAFSGVARFVGPLLALNGVLGAVGARGGLQSRLGAGLSQATLGLLPPATATSLVPGVLGALPGAALSRFAPSLVARGVEGAIGPQLLGGISSGALGALGGVGLGAAGVYAGFLANPATAGASLSSPQGRALASGIVNQANAVRSTQNLQDFQANVAHIPLRFEMSPADQQKLNDLVRRATAVAAQNAGGSASNAWENAFVRGLERGVAPDKAVAQMLAGMQSQIQQLGPKGALAFAKNTAQWAAQMQAANPALQRPMRLLMEGIVHDINVANKTVGDSFKDLQSKVFFFNGEILTGSQTTWGHVRDALVDPVQVAQEKLLGIFGQIQQEAINALTGMGFSQSQAKDIVAAQTSGDPRRQANAQALVGGSQAAGAAANAITNFITPGRATGGRTGGYRLPGTGTLDTVRMVDGGLGAPGEIVLNQHTERDVNHDLSMAGKPSLDQRVRSETRKHSTPTGMGAGYQLGGFLSGLGSALSHAVGAITTAVSPVGRQHPELHPGIAQAVQAVLDHFPGLSITSTTGGGHASGSYHYLGEAADIAGGSGLMLQAADWINQNIASGLTEGIHNPNLSVKSGHQVPSSFWGPAVWGQHLNHIHMAVAGAFAAGALAGGGGAQLGLAPQQIGALKVPGTNLHGVPGALVTRGGTIYAGALTQKVNQMLASTGGMNFAGVPGSGGAPSANQQLGQAMMLAAGWGPEQWPALQALWTQESGWNANAVNPSSGAAGIPQALGHGHAFNLGDARAQIAWGLNYIRQRYGSPAAAEAHERAFNWYGQGADMVVRRPTVFGAGENGPERVKITPLGHGGGPITIHRGAVQINAAGGDHRAMARYVERRLEQFAQEVADEIAVGAEQPTVGALG